MLIDKRKLRASILKDSFYDFVQFFWDVVVPDPPVWNWHIKVMCDELQTVAERVFRNEPKEYDLLLNVPPGTTKSKVASVFFPAWIWTRKASLRSLCVSYADNLALDLSRQSRDVVESDRWREHFGEIALREDQNTKTYFMNEAGGFRYCAGTNGTITGFHGHFIIVDDPLDPNRAISDAERLAANRWINQTLEKRKTDARVTVMILIMQRLHEDDPSAQMLSKRDDAPVRHIKLPAEIVGNGRNPLRKGSGPQVSPRKLAKFYKDGLLDPIRLPRTVLKSNLARMGQYGYAGQMLQDPVPVAGGMFETGKIRIEQPPAWVEFKRVIRFWDKAGSHKSGAQTVGAKLGLDRRDRIWVLDIVRGQWGSGDRENTIDQTADADTRKVEVGLEQEPGSGGKESAEKTATRLALKGIRVRVDRPTGNKVLRADPFSVQCNFGNLYLAPGPWNNEYIGELQHFPHSQFKDQVDASSGAYNLLTKKRHKIGGRPWKQHDTRSSASRRDRRARRVR